MSLSEINVNIPEQSFELDDKELKLKCPFKLMISGQERSLTKGWVAPPPPPIFGSDYSKSWVWGPPPIVIPPNIKSMTTPLQGALVLEKAGKVTF